MINKENVITVIDSGSIGSGHNFKKLRYLLNQSIRNEIKQK